MPGIAAADLYRWVDPQSGSVKFSSTPPPWYESGSGPAVERVPYGAPAPRAPGKDTPSPLSDLQARWGEALRLVSVQPTREALERFDALNAELDRADPRGRERRREEASAVLRKLQSR